MTDLRRRFLLLTALRWLPVGFIAPLLALIPLDRGLTLAQVGVVFAVYGATTALFELPTGGLADSVGRRPMLVLASVLHVAFYALLLVVDTLGAWVAAAAIGGLSRALDSGPLEAWFVDEARKIDPEAELRSGLSRAGAVEAAGLAVAAVLGGLIPTWFGGNLDAALVPAMGLQVVHLGAAAALLVERRPTSPERLRTALAGTGRVVLGGVRMALGSRPVGMLLLASAAIGLGLTGVEVLWQPRLTDLLGGRSQTGPLGFVLAAVFAGAAVGSALSPRLVSALGGRTSRAALVGGLGHAGVYAGLAAATGFGWAAVSMVVVYLLLGARSPIHHELLHEHVRPEERTTMLSAQSLSLQAGGALSSLCLPALAGAVGIPWAWGVGAVLLALSALLYLGVPDQPSVAGERRTPLPARRPARAARRAPRCHQPIPGRRPR